MTPIATERKNSEASASKRTKDAFPRSTAGIALVLVVVMLSFVVVLLVGLTVYSRLETNIAGNNQKMTQARRNALMALDVALGQLQKHAGADQRVTATATGWGGTTNPYWTGVWSGTTSTSTPLTWLVSGSEFGTVTPKTATSTSTRVELVGRYSALTANSVVVNKQEITMRGQPGISGTPRIGWYAWWVGDQGVKAPVALPDPTLPFYSPYNTSDMQARVRQQMAFGARPSAIDAKVSGSTYTRSYLDEFEPRSTLNRVLDLNVTWPQQMAAMMRVDNKEFGLDNVANSSINKNKYGIRKYFHTWSPNNFAVLCNTKLGGLRTDLSLKPDAIGAGFTAWQDYSTSSTAMETPTTASAKTPKPLPSYASTNDLRRRYVITPPTVTTTSSPTGGVAPVLTAFAGVFSIVRNASVGNIEVRFAWQANLWNPYTSAMVPEALYLEVTGLPTSLAIRDNSANGANPTVLGQVSLQDLYGGSATSPMVINLPWPYAGASSTSLNPLRNTQVDYQSWLPGRTYSWSQADTISSDPSSGTTGKFHSKLSTGMNYYWRRPISSISVSSNGRLISAKNDTATVLTIKLKRKKDGALLATYTSPSFVAFTTSGVAANNSNPRFAYYFRLSEYYADNNTNWLKVADPRSAAPPASLYSVVNTNPTNSGVTSLSSLVNSHLFNADRLFSREVNSTGAYTGQSYNESVPLFELPRGPILSVGMLQHLQIVGQRPFLVGNSWGSASGVNSYFDKYFFSGLAGTARTSWVSYRGWSYPSTSIPFPNVLLYKMPRRVAGDGFVQTDFIPTSIQGWETACHTMQSGAFNINSTDIAAWHAVLCGTRFMATSPVSFSYLAADYRTGTGSSGTSATSVIGSTMTTNPPTHPTAVGRNSLVTNDRRSNIPTEAVFFRFSQTAQETYKADDPRNPTTNNFMTWAAASNEPKTTSTPSPSSKAPSQLYRRGAVMLSPIGARLLAENIVTQIKKKQAASGPFRSMEEFLAPASLFSNVSLLERAISDSGINGTSSTYTITEPLSSQYLTAADVMTALAPILFARSDTFIIRSYGEVVNPFTQLTEGKAWCEAIVQRYPEPFLQKRNASNVLQNFTATEYNSSTYLSTAGRRFKVIGFRWLTPQDL